MIQKFLSNIQMIWMIFIKILKNTIQIKKILIAFNDMIWFMKIPNKSELE